MSHLVANRWLSRQVCTMTLTRRRLINDSIFPLLPLTELSHSPHTRCAERSLPPDIPQHSHPQSKYPTFPQFYILVFPSDARSHLFICSIAYACLSNHECTSPSNGVPYLVTRSQSQRRKRGIGKEPSACVGSGQGSAVFRRCIS